MSPFADRFSGKTGILELMDDLGTAMQGRADMLMLGGGNPAHIPEVNAVWRKRVEEIMAQGTLLEETLANYDTPQGKHSFLDAVAGFLHREYGWKVEAKNIAITNGSQTASFLLLNLFAGKTMFPLAPEYIGYADQSIDPADLTAVPAQIELRGHHRFKYHVDFDNLHIDRTVGALCVSRPTNPTGNVLTDDEIHRLAGLARGADIPLIIDNAYGAPFPSILFRDVTPYWDDHVILSMSLSKLGLPSVRTGIVVAHENVIQAVSASNAVISLANGSLGQVLAQPLVESGEILHLARDVIRPFYQERSKLAMAAIDESFGPDLPYRLHENEGTFFLWLWLPDLPVGSDVLYQRLKDRGVLVVSGHYFFYGLEGEWDHRHRCIRLNYALDPARFREAAGIIADEVRVIRREFAPGS